MRLVTCLLLALFLSRPAICQEKCDIDVFVDKGIKQLSKSSGYTFLKSHPVSGEEGKTYSYIFSHGTEYLITLANENIDAKGVYITIYDSNRKEITSSFNNGKFYPSIIFTCQTTGIYYLHYEFEGTKDFCAAGVLGIKR